MSCEFQRFTHANCEYFPCHKGIAAEEFNCLFCYCPLYPLGAECGGNVCMTESGVKDCSGCAKPHGRDGYEFIMARISAVIERTKEVPHGEG